MKYYRTKLIILFMFVSICSFGQGMKGHILLFRQSFVNSNITNRFKDVEHLKKRTSSLIKKNPYLSSLKGLRQYHIFELYPCGSFYGNKDYEDAAFLLDLRYGYYDVKVFFRKKKYMRDRTIITDSIGNIVAYGCARFLFVPNKPKKEDPHDLDSEIARLFFSGEIDMAFYTLQYPNRYICLKDEHLYVLESVAGNLKFREWRSFCSSLFCEDRDTNEHK